MNARLHDSSRSKDDSIERVMDEVMKRIRHSRLMRARMTAGVYGTLALTSLAAFVPAIKYLIGSASQSGFMEYASLLSSDTGSVLQSWREFLISITDSMPIMGAIAVVTVILALAISARSLAKSITSLSLNQARST